MGRASYSRRKIIEHSAGISIQDLRNYKLLNRGPLKATWISQVTSTSSGLLADITWTINIAPTEGLDGKSYLQFVYDYKGEHISFKHPIESQPVHFGGHRYFFRCSCSKAGEYCGRRVKTLYFAGNVWACRHCLDLVYNECRNHRNDIYRFRNKAETLYKKTERLKASNHHRKANLLKKKAELYEIKARVVLHKQMIKWLDRHRG